MEITSEKAKEKKLRKIRGAPPGLSQFLATESSLKMMKNAFYFTFKALFVLKVFKFLSCFDHVGKWLGIKPKDNFRIYYVSSVKLITTIHILPNISRGKGNHTVKVCQLIEYLRREIFFLKHHRQNAQEKLVPSPSSKNGNWAKLWINSLNFYKVYFDYVQV